MPVRMILEMLACGSVISLFAWGVSLLEASGTQGHFPEKQLTISEYLLQTSDASKFPYGSVAIHLAPGACLNFPSEVPGGFASCD
jgi:hypothetical protein